MLSSIADLPLGARGNKDLGFRICRVGLLRERHVALNSVSIRCVVVELVFESQMRAYPRNSR
jgi:hypothetical protein